MPSVSRAKIEVQMIWGQVSKHSYEGCTVSVLHPRHLPSSAQGRETMVASKRGPLKGVPFWRAIVPLPGFFSFVTCQVTVDRLGIRQYYHTFTASQRSFSRPVSLTVSRRCGDKPLVSNISVPTSQSYNIYIYTGWWFGIFVSIYWE